jgi:hypothetical protein
VPFAMRNMVAIIFRKNRATIDTAPERMAIGNGSSRPLVTSAKPIAVTKHVSIIGSESAPLTSSC